MVATIVWGCFKALVWGLALIGLATLLLALMIATPIRRPPELASISQTAGAVDRSDMPGLERFSARDGTVLADRDASCWAGALDAIFGIGTHRGLSLCLRLLALIDLLAHSPWAIPLLRLARDGAEPDPALLQAAATEPLTPDARFDQTGFRARLTRTMSKRLTGASV